MEATREIELSAGTIRYLDTGGDGPVLLFVHGLLATPALWRPVVERLSGDVRSIVPELPLGAHTRPAKPDADITPRGVARLLAELIQKLDLRDVTVVGNDTGGAISQLLVTEHPDRIARLILTPSDSFEYFFPPRFRPLQWASKVPGLLTLAVQPMRSSLVFNSPLGFGDATKRKMPREVTSSLMRPYFTNRGIRRDMEKFIRGVSNKDTLAAAERLRDFDRPALLVWAREDKFFPVKLAERLLERLPNGRLELVDDSYTFIPIDQPEQLTRLIREFVFDSAREEVTT
jgi:pimeloyl-ACP methyl ester carboxylesterase